VTAPYAVRRIVLTFQIGKSGSGVIQLATGNPGLRIHVHVEFANVPETGAAQIRVYGLSLDHMNQLSVAGLVFESRQEQNFVAIQAGDDVSGMATIFKGQIIQAYPDFARQPDVSFYIQASPSNVIQMKPVEPSTFTGPTSAATALDTIVKKAGLTLENNGVNAILASPYFPGTAWQQILGLIRAANCFGFLDGVTKTLAVWPKEGSRSGGKIVISPENGMIGYPQFQALNTVTRTLFNTEVSPADPGKLITIKSQLSAANGDFTVIGVTHDLMSEMPDGPWETTIIATPTKLGEFSPR
jgi:hypothetical protein